MIVEAIAQVVMEVVAYPVLYVIGYLTLKTLSLGSARILPLTDHGYEKEMKWYQLFVCRSGLRFWSPESTIFVGALSGLILFAAVYLIWRCI